MVSPDVGKILYSSKKLTSDLKNFTVKTESLMKLGAIKKVHKILEKYFPEFNWFCFCLLKLNQMKL